MGCAINAWHGFLPGSRFGGSGRRDGAGLVGSAGIGLMVLLVSLLSYPTGNSAERKGQGVLERTIRCLDDVRVYSRGRGMDESGGGDARLKWHQKRH